LIKKLALGVGALVALTIFAFALWYFRPWSDLSPSDVSRLKNLDERIEVYREMDEVLPSRKIEGVSNPLPLPRNIQPLNVTYEFDGKQKSLDGFIKERTITGLVVLKDGVLVHESYYLGEEPESRHTSWSVAKSYIATLVAMALEEGLISSIDDKVKKYVPEFAGTDYGDTSIRNLLMMSSGIDFNEDYEAEGSDIRNLFFGVFVFNADVDKMVRKYKRNRPAGQDFDYISPNTHVLSTVVRAVYGKPIAAIIDEKLYKPLGMPTAYWNQDRKGEKGKAIGYCCLSTRAVDYARFGQLYLQDGVWQGKRILPEGWVDSISTPRADFQEPVPGEHFGYSYQFWIPPDYEGEFFAAGYNGQIIWVDRKRGVVIVRTSADRYYIENADENIAVMRAIAKAVSGEDLGDALRERAAAQ
jgi:CubicO group peptidase (beta-lactamase class C family)